jgi:hypothetical protein
MKPATTASINSCFVTARPIIGLFSWPANINNGSI